jgi:F-type H+-transporting ATPase subunit delta
MSEIRVATRYAQSLFDMAQERKAVDKILEDAQGILNTISENRALGNMLKSPIVHEDTKMKVLDKLFGSKIDELTKSFIRIVMRKKREIILRDIFEAFRQMVLAQKGILTATVYTAVPISNRITKDIKSFLEAETKRQVELNTEVKEDLMGGLVIRYEDKLIDASVSSQLKALRNHLINNN